MLTCLRLTPWLTHCQLKGHTVAFRKHVVTANYFSLSAWDNNSPKLWNLGQTQPGEDSSNSVSEGQLL